MVKGQLMAIADEEPGISDLLIDSRKLISPAGCLFCALKTKKNDGHNYIRELYFKGVRNFIISDPDFDTAKIEKANVILVNDTLDALQALCASHREKFNIPVIGITGSNGKTIVKEWLFQLLQDDYQVIRSPKSYNSQTGVPLSVWNLKPGHNLGIFEAGISEPDEMAKLQKIIQPTLGIYTNLGPAHSENFISERQKAGEKLKLFTKVDTLIYSLDYPEIRETVIKSQILKSIKVFTWSFTREADLRILSSKVTDRKTTLITGVFQSKEISVQIPFTDKGSVENAIHCWALLLHLGYKNDDIAERLTRLQPIAMRLELKEGINHCSIVNDSYNSDINSLTIAIDFLNQQNQNRDKTVILSDILQSGRDDPELYSEIAKLLDKKGINKLIGIGSAISRQKDKFRLEKQFYDNTQDFLRQHSFMSFQNETILLKGARVFEFELISQALQQKTHETVLEINLNALVNNLNYYRERVGKGTKIMAMVKAYSYGTGSFEIANTLQFHNIDYLAVAYADEGVELRKAGINTPIMVMNPDEHSMDSIIQHNLEPEIYNFRILSILEKAIRKNILPENKPVKIHVKLDSGMHRLGFEEHETGSLVKRLHCNKQIHVQTVFSHLAASDDPAEDNFTLGQIEKFRAAAGKLRKALNPSMLIHILNSAGINRFPEARFDMVRLGISLYGIPTHPEDVAHLENVNTLKSSISQIKTIPEGETVGYNRRWRAAGKSRIAIVPIGYADGLKRQLGNGKGSLYVNGKPAPVIGEVCMDMCMIDVTAISASEGDEVIVFGKDYPISQLAHDIGTIPYDLLSGISRRVKRIYFHE